jgi:hypothetical protein
MKYLNYFESFDIKSIPFEETQFKELIRKLAPNNFNKYYSLFKNKGLEIAKKKLLDDSSQIKELENEVKKIRRYEDRGRKNVFNIVSEDLSYYKPSKKDTKQSLSEGLLNNNLKKIYNKLGFHSLNGSDVRPDDFGNSFLLSTENYEYTTKTNKYDTEIEVNYYDNSETSFTLGSLVNKIEFFDGTSQRAIDVTVQEELDQTKISGTLYRNFSLVYKQTLTPIWSKLLNVDLTFEMSYGVKTIYHDNYVHYDLMDLNVHEGMNGKFIPMQDEGAVELLKSIKEKTTTAFTKLGNKIKGAQKQAEAKYKEYIDYIISACVMLLNENGAKYYRNIKLIKENYPNAWIMISKHINDEEGLNKATNMGDMGFGD